MTDLSREYGDGLYALCAEEGIAKEVLEQLQALKACFDEQPDFCLLLSNMSLSKQERELIEAFAKSQDVSFTPEKGFFDKLKDRLSN